MSMNCCKCGKELDVDKNDVPPKWFGLYNGWILKKVICSECIKKPENKGDWWRDEE